MSIICKQCGYENPDGSTICEICTEELSAAPAPVQPAATAPVVNYEATVAQAVTQTDDKNEYSVFCPESQTKTILPHGNLTSFYCEGCKKEHEIDGFLWTVEKKKKNDSAVNTAPRVSPQPRQDIMWLEEMNSHFRIEIDKTGGTLGRYGKYGADFFQSRGLLMVSGEHCLITNEFGNWVIRHISRTNQTMYNNMILGANEPNLPEDGKILTLANAVSFIVRIS